MSLSDTGEIELDAIRRELDSLAGRINGDYGQFDWTPVRRLPEVAALTTYVAYSGFGIDQAPVDHTGERGTPGDIARRMEARNVSRD